MILAYIIVSSIAAYIAAGLALWFGAGWLMSLLILSGVGSSTLLAIALIFGRSSKMSPHIAGPSVTNPVH